MSNKKCIDSMRELIKTFGNEWIDQLNENWDEVYEVMKLDAVDSKEFEDLVNLYDDSELDSIFDNWIEFRSAWYKVIKKVRFKTQSFEFAWEDFHSVNLGSPEFTCKTCGVIYFDNYSICGKEFEGSVNFYKGNCSEFCKKNMIQNCLICGIDFKPNQTKSISEEYGWAGTCSKTCLNLLTQIKKKINDDKKYLAQVKRRLERYSKNFEIDSSVTRSKVYEKYKGICAECSVETDFFFNSLNRLTYATVDHITPISKGGNHIWKNVQLLCQHCNSTKKNKLLQ